MPVGLVRLGEARVVRPYWPGRCHNAPNRPLPGGDMCSSGWQAVNFSTRRRRYPSARIRASVLGPSDLRGVPEGPVATSTARRKGTRSMYVGGRKRRGFSGLRTLGWLVVVMMLALAVMPTAAIAANGDVEIEQDNNTNGCNGVVTTPGSENTNKQLIGGSLEPGGTARFLITYPVDPADVAGREEFEITDCVFIGDDAVAKYFIHF